MNVAVASLRHLAGDSSLGSPAGAQHRIGDAGLTRHLVSTALVVLAAVLLSLCVALILVSRLEHSAAQNAAFNRFRTALALGTAPVGPARVGTPVALLEIRSIGVHEVVLEGTTSKVLTSGPGHLRTTVVPGEAGYSTVFGRAAAYGGPFGGLHRLRRGNTIDVTTGAGKAAFKVIDLRRDGDPFPPAPGRGAGRLTLITAKGTPFLPSGVLYVDADLVGTAKPAAAPALSSAPPSERIMGTDTSDLWELVLLLQALIVVSSAAVWSWWRWGHQQTWIVFFPALALVGYYVSDQVVRLLPNVL